MQQLLKESGTTTVLVTHDQDEALSTADRVAVLRDGAIAQCAAPQELYSCPVDADMARFIGEANLIPGTLNGSSVQTLLGRLAVTSAGPAAGKGAGADRTGRERQRRAGASTGHGADPAGAGRADSRDPGPGPGAGLTRTLRGHRSRKHRCGRADRADHWLRLPRA